MTNTQKPYKKEKARNMRIRQDMKTRRPPFKRVGSWKLAKVSDVWRKQRGIDNRSRKHKKGGIISPKVGYRTPKMTRHLHPSGLLDVLITNERDLEGLNSRVHGVRIDARLGGRKRYKLIEKAMEQNFHVFNAKLHTNFSLGLEESIEDESDEDLD